MNAHGKFINKEALKPGELVIWSCSEELRGSIGLVKKYYAELATVVFPEGEWNFKAASLRKVGEGDTMRYTGKNRNVPTTGFGQVARIQPTGMISVQYLTGSVLEKNSWVKYCGTEDRIPKDEFGMVYEHNEKGVVVQYPTRKWENLPPEDLRLEFDIPYVALKYIDVKTALTASFRETVRRTQAAPSHQRPGTAP